MMFYNDFKWQKPSANQILEKTSMFFPTQLKSARFSSAASNGCDSDTLSGFPGWYFSSSAHISLCLIPGFDLCAAMDPDQVKWPVLKTSLQMGRMQILLNDSPKLRLL